MKNRGFTLVEVIVVAVIVAVIAATATLLYSGYIEQAKKDTVDEMAKVAASSGNAFYRRTSEIPTVSDLNIFMADVNRFEIVINEDELTITVKDISGRPDKDDIESEAISFE